MADTLHSHGPDISSQLLSLSSRAKDLGLTTDHLSSLRLCRLPLRSPRRWYLLGTAICVVVSLVVGVLVRHSTDVTWSVILHHFHPLGSTNTTGITSEICLLDFSEFIMDSVRPPADCSFCRNVSQVERVARLSRDRFERDFAYSGTPVVVTDAMTEWTAPGVFTFDYFRSIYDEDSATLTSNPERRDCQFFPYQTEFDNLGMVLEMSSERFREPWYVGWSNCDSKVGNELRRHYSKPYFLPAESESSRVDWVFMGTPGYGANMHVDSVENPSWQAQVRGEKRWTLEPPPECYFSCKGEITVTVGPGEVIVLDTNMWYHKTEVVGEEISIVIGSEYD